MLWTILAVATFDVLVWFVVALGVLSPAWGLGSVGIVTFLGTLVIGYSETEKFNKGAIQLAITASVLAVFFALAPLFIFPGPVAVANTDLANNTIGQFSTVVEVVVAFYMGTATLGYSVKVWGISKAMDEKRAGLIKDL